MKERERERERERKNTEGGHAGNNGYRMEERDDQ